MKSTNTCKLNALIIIIGLTLSCSSIETDNHSIATDSLIPITEVQFQNESMIIGSMETREFEDLVLLNGMIKANPKGMAIVSTYVSGLVSNISCSIGNYVTKGQVLCSLSSKEIVMLQQEFAETAGKLNGLKLDYQRVKVLNDEKISSQKDFIAIESEYKSTLARYEGLKSQLNLMNINTQKVEDGNIVSSFNLYAPISGYITSQKCISGQYVELNMALFEIVDINQLQLELSVYEKDISKLKLGQKVRFYIQNKNSEPYYSELISVGKSIDPVTKSILCIAKLQLKDCLQLINQMYVQAEIIVNQYKAKAAPNEAIIKAGDNFYVFTQQKTENNIHYLKKYKIKTGAVANGFTEITNNENFDNIILKGVYNLSVE